MTKIRVAGFTGLVRDTNSNAIVNVNKSEYQLYMSRVCLLYTSPSPRDLSTSRMPSSA